MLAVRPRWQEDWFSLKSTKYHDNGKTDTSKLARTVIQLEAETQVPPFTKTPIKKNKYRMTNVFHTDINKAIRLLNCSIYSFISKHWYPLYFYLNNDLDRDCFQFLVFTQLISGKLC